MLQTVFFDVESPVNARGRLLDNYLQEGWFRSSNMMLRSNLLCMSGSLSETINIRYRLAGYEHSRRMRKLLRRNARRFRHVVRRASITARKRSLYREHLTRYRGIIVPTLDQYMAGSFYRNSPFQTMEITVFDGKRIAAVSYFDVGVTSVASILGIFDHAYAEYSLGIYTMLLEVEWARQQGMQCYYPGYILDNDPIFDYKLRLGQAEYYDWKGNWLPFDNTQRHYTLAQLNRRKLSELAQALQQSNISYRYYAYPMAYLGYLTMPFTGDADIFRKLAFVKDFIFLFVGRQRDGGVWIAAYDLNRAGYHLAKIYYSPLNSMMEQNFELFFDESPCTVSDVLYYQEFYYFGHEVGEIVRQIDQLQRHFQLDTQADI